MTCSHHAWKLVGGLVQAASPPTQQATPLHSWQLLDVSRESSTLLNWYRPKGGRPRLVGACAGGLPGSFARRPLWEWHRHKPTCHSIGLVIGQHERPQQVCIRLLGQGSQTWHAGASRTLVTGPGWNLLQAPRCAPHIQVCRACGQRSAAPAEADAVAMLHSRRMLRAATCPLPNRPTAVPARRQASRTLRLLLSALNSQCCSVLDLKQRELSCRDANCSVDMP